MPDEVGRCTVVQGAISPEGWCDSPLAAVEVGDEVKCSHCVNYQPTCHVCGDVLSERFRHPIIRGRPTCEPCAVTAVNNTDAHRERVPQADQIRRIRGLRGEAVDTIIINEKPDPPSIERGRVVFPGPKKRTVWVKKN